jgi:hypothetical protein
MIYSRKAIAIALFAVMVTAMGVDTVSAQKTIDEILTGGPSARLKWKQRVVRNSSSQTPRFSAPAVEKAEATPVSRTSHSDVVFEESRLLDAESTIVVGETELEPMAVDGFAPTLGTGQGCSDCGNSECGNCGDCIDRGGCDECYDDCGLECCGLLASRWMKHLSVFAGVQGFKGPVDLGQNGNFGFHEGLNFAAPLGGPGQIGYQIGFRAVQSNLAGSSLNTGLDRDQVFVTAGLFRRALCGGLQWALAFDLMHDRHYYGKSDMKQVRLEAAFVRPGVREIGFWGAFGTGDDQVTYGQNTDTIEPTSLYAFFYRKYLNSGGQGRLWVGFTGQGDGLLGGDLRMPIGHSWAVESNFNYLSPKQGKGATGFAQESWGTMVQLVWYPGRSARCVAEDPYNPILNVADNSVFMVDRTQN